MLLSAALFAAGALSSMAQSSVYSLNVVGYVTVQVPAAPGFALLANPFTDGNGNFLTNAIVGDDGSQQYLLLPDSTTLFPWSASGSYGNSQYFYQGLGWYDPSSPSTVTNTIPPGAGWWIQSGSTNFSITFVGNVVQGTTNVSLATGFTLIGSPIPVSLPLGAATVTAGPNDPTAPTLQMYSGDSDQVYTFNNGGGYGTSPFYYQGSGWYDGNIAGGGPTNGPTIVPGQGFWFSRVQEDASPSGGTPVAGPDNWTVSFTVQ